MREVKRAIIGTLMTLVILELLILLIVIIFYGLDEFIEICIDNLSTIVALFVQFDILIIIMVCVSFIRAENSEGDDDYYGE